MSKKGIVTIILILLGFALFELVIFYVSREEQNNNLESNLDLINTIKISVLDYADEINLKITSSYMNTDVTDDIYDGVYTVEELKNMGINRKSKVLVDGWVRIKNERVVDYSIRYIFGKTFFISNYINISNAEVIEKGVLREIPVD